MPTNHTSHTLLILQAVRTAMLGDSDGAIAGVDGILETSDVAKCVSKAVEAGEFLITPHEVVRKYLKRKASDYDRWIRGMQRATAA